MPMREILRTYGLIDKKRAHLDKLFEDVSRSQICLAVNDVTVVTEARNHIDHAETYFKEAIGTLLDGCRTGQHNAGQTGQFCTEYAAFISDYHPVGKHHAITEKLDLYHKLRENNVRYIGRVNPTALDIFTEAEETVVLYYYQSQSETDTEGWAILLAKFLALVNEVALVETGTNFVFIDCELSGQDGPEGVKANGMVRYRNGEPVLGESQDDASEEEIPLAKPCITPEKSVKAGEPKKRGNVNLPCPASKPGGCPQGAAYGWKCSACQQPLEYGFDDHFYCKCGRSLAESYMFRCGQPGHRTEYVGFQSTVLAKLLDQIQQLKEINILILGETGVGKSTWINGFLNFVTYSTLNDALVEPVYLIPTSFSMMNEKNQMQKISMGKTDDKDETGKTTAAKASNENDKTGQSCTQMPQTYVFKKGDSLIRLIDTPGIGDTRGLDQDKKNFQFIMNHLSHYESVHGICILLKPNNARLTVMFEFCIKELLKHLHRDACQNIVFVFTNARSTFYRPGDSYPALQELIASAEGVKITLEGGNVYCVDNEAVRFMAAIKSGMTFHNKEQENFQTSWETSVAETERLLLYVSKRTPHMLRETLSLNEVRRQILAFTEPLGHITQNIHTNIQAITDKADEIKQLETSKQGLKGRLYTPIVDLESIPLQHPRTVCAAKKCIKLVGQKVNYVTWCHDNCGLTGIQPGVYPQPGLQSCAAMDSTRLKCTHCGCPWDMHMHIEYELRETIIEALDPHVQDLLNQKDGAIMAVQVALQGLEKFKDELAQEMEAVNKAASKFGYFLKANAMIPFNDAMEEYLRYMLRAEEQKVALTGNRKKLEDYQTTLNSYLEEKKILGDAMKSGAHHEKITAHDIEAEIKSLYELPHNGKMIKNLVETQNLTDGQQIQHSETIYMPENQKKRPSAGLFQQGAKLAKNAKDALFTLFGSVTSRGADYDRDSYSPTRGHSSYRSNSAHRDSTNHNSKPWSDMRGETQYRSPSPVYSQQSLDRNYRSNEPSYPSNYGAAMSYNERATSPNDTFGRKSYNDGGRNIPLNDSHRRQMPSNAHYQHLTEADDLRGAFHTGDRNMYSTSEPYGMTESLERTASRSSGSVPRRGETYSYDRHNAAPSASWAGNTYVSNEPHSVQYAQQSFPDLVRANPPAVPTQGGLYRVQQLPEQRSGNSQVNNQAVGGYVETGGPLGRATGGLVGNTSSDLNRMHVTQRHPNNR